jgi:hypothetical protein
MSLEAKKQCNKRTGRHDPAFPSAVVDWGSGVIGVNDESSRNFRGFLMGLPLFAGAVCAPTVSWELDVGMAVICVRPLIVHRSEAIKREPGTAVGHQLMRGGDFSR